jgi:hypothetical protein
MEKILSFRDFNTVNEEFNFISTDNNFDELSSYVELSEDEMVSLFNDEIYEAAPSGNTVKGGLFDLNDKKVYNSVKNVKTAIVKGAKYTFLTIGQGMKAYADAQVKVAKAAGGALLNLAKFVGKVVIFTAAGLYVVTEAVANGLLGLATSVVGYVKKGAVAIGSTIVSALKNANDYFKRLGTAVFSSIKNDAEAVAKGFMKGLYAVANTCTKAKEALATLTYAAGKLAKTAFKSIANFTTSCVYNVAKAVGVVAIKIGKGISDFYNGAVSVVKSAKDSIVSATKAGVNAVATGIKAAVNKTAQVASKIKSGVAATFKAAQSKIANTAKEIGSVASAIWGAIWDHEIYQGTAQDIFESYFIVEGQKYYVLLESDEDFDSDVFGSDY